MMLYQQGRAIDPAKLTVKLHDAGFAMVYILEDSSIFVNTTDEADALIAVACEAKRLLLAKREPADWCTAHTGPDDELDRAVYCDRQAGHPGSHRGAVGDGSEVAWPDAEPAELVALKQEMDPPSSGCGEQHPDGYICTRHDDGHHVAGVGAGEAARWPIETAALCEACDNEPATVRLTNGEYCEACAPGVQMVTGADVVADGSGEHCHKSGPHKTHRDSNGDTWTDAVSVPGPHPDASANHYGYAPDESASVAS